MACLTFESLTDPKNNRTTVLCNLHSLSLHSPVNGANCRSLGSQMAKNATAQEKTLKGPQCYGTFILRIDGVPVVANMPLLYKKGILHSLVPVMFEKLCHHSKDM